MTNSYLSTYIAELSNKNLADASASFHDELMDSSGQVAAHWHPVMDHLSKLGQGGIERLQTDVRRLLHENGVTYNAFGTSEAQQRQWALDVLPLIIAEDEWRKIEAGIIQRAELLNRILIDLYGPQTLIKERLLPLDLVHLDPGFLRPCHGTTLPGNHLLIHYAADLARGPDGRMWVVADKTQAPSGSGYALENRTIMSQVQPKFFQEKPFSYLQNQGWQFQGKQAQSNHIQSVKISRLSGYFRDLKSTLTRLGPSSNSPRIVVMTPGPHSETYFEHAYLASYLGYTLVQGDDLSVYNGGVNLKALDGLQPVDTILRRVDDTFCDPLELRSDSYLGVTGLLESVRRGRVTVVNPLGSGLVENLGIMPFLQGIANEWLGEDLILPMAATWWCGQEEEMHHVFKNLDELIIRPISGQFREPPILPERLSASERTSLIERIRAKPYRYVGQQRVSFSTAPTMINGELKPRLTILRSFALARQDDYTVMPGGLTRSAKSEEGLVVSTSEGGISKDTWVLTQEPQRHVSLWELQADRAIEAFHSAESLPSRSAENLFWVGRYTERVESSARFLRTIFDFFLGEYNLDSMPDSGALHQLLGALTQVTMTYPGFIGEEGEEGAKALKECLANPLKEVLAVALNAERSGSLHSDLRATVGAAYAVRDLWSMDSWRVLQEIDGPWAQLAAEFTAEFTKANQQGSAPRAEQAVPATNQPVRWDEQSRDAGLANQDLSQHVNRELNQLITQLMALVGLYSDSMTQSAGWAMLDMGRRLERVLRTVALIRSTLVIEQETSIEHLLLEATLKTTDNIITYRRRYRSHLQLQTVLDLLLLDNLNPRSLIFQLNELQAHLEQLPRAQASYQLSREEQIVTLAKTRLQLADTALLSQPQNGSVLRQLLDDLMAELSLNLSELSTVVTQTYFTHAQVKQQFGTAQAELLG